MSPFFMLALAGVAAILGWSYMRGHARWVSLSGIWLVIAVSLVGAAACQVVGLPEAGDVFNVAALVLSLAGLAAGPQLWEDQMRAEAATTRKRGARFQPRDAISWAPWQEAARRIGPERSALLWLVAFGLAWAVNLASAWAARPEDDRGYLLAALASPGLFGLLSTVWMYRGVKRVFGTTG